MVHFLSKIPNLGKFWRVFHGRCWYMAIWSISHQLGMFYGHLVYFMVIWYFLPILVCCIKINLATLFSSTHDPSAKAIEANQFALLTANTYVYWQINPF
jgi:hypothetical protein